MFLKWNLIPLLVIISRLVYIQTSCDFKFCNFEGVCSNNNCNCIGDQYFTGTRCQDIVNHCSTNPCKNNGKCINFVGQHVCDNCPTANGGQNCHIELPNVFTKMLLHFNHYAYYGYPHEFLIMVEQLGKIEFSLELTADNYAIASMEINPSINDKKLKKQWHKTNNLAKVFSQLKLKHSTRLPYTTGYYHIAKQTFWTKGMLTLTLRAYDTETALKELFLHEYKLLVVQLPSLKDTKCTPKLEFVHGSDPFKPLKVDIARYNNFEPILKQRCHPNSFISYEWKIYNSIGTVELFNFGRTHKPLLKVPPYRLWFDYHGEVMSSYRIEVAIRETLPSLRQYLSKERCFIFVLPKPVNAVIKGGEERDVGVGQSFVLDGSDSRDFALSPKVKQNMFFKWSCSSTDDPDNRICKNFKSKDSKVKLKISGGNQLILGKTYTFHLKINSKINVYSTSEATQIVTIVERTTLFLHIKCIRNCLNHRFVADKFIHLKVEADNIDLSSKSFATIKWTLNGNEEIGKEKRLIYTPSQATTPLIIRVHVEHKGKEGKASIKLLKNEPPSGGSCSIAPTQGIAFDTEFNITCKDYHHSNTPITYQFIADDYLVDRTNDQKAQVRLPPTQAVNVIVCDQFNACTENKLSVTVQQLPDAETYLQNHKNILRQLLKNGNVAAALVLCNTLAKSTITLKNANLMVKELRGFVLNTLLNVEQLITIAKDLCKNITPLDNEKALMFEKYFYILRKSFWAIIRDGEIEDLMAEPYLKASKELAVVLNEFATTWEEIPIVHIIETEMVTRDDPLAEKYEEFPDFDVTALTRINNWLAMAQELNECLNLLGVASVNMHFPSEKALQFEEASSKFNVYAIDLKENKKDLTINETSFTITLPKPYLNEVRMKLKSSTVIIQRIVMENRNPFWWYPDNYGINTDVMYFSTYSASSFPGKQSLRTKTPFDLVINIKNKTTTGEEAKVVNSYLINHLHMPIFNVAAPGRSIVIVRFLQVSIDLKILLKCGKCPRSFEVEKSGHLVKADQLEQKFHDMNTQGKEKLMHMAILSKDRTGTDLSKKKTNFSFVFEIQQCLTWDFSLPDPQWSGEGCQAMPSTKDDDLKCQCYHLSTYGGKTYTAVATENLRDSMLLESLQFNWFLFLFYIMIIVLSAFILFYVNYCRGSNEPEILITNIEKIQYDAEVFLYTGGYRNATTSANIIIRFITSKGPNTVVVYQTDPEKPQLKQNSVCKFYMPSDYVKAPIKLNISNDQSGRYPSWYCKKIIINDTSTEQVHIFHVEQWISKQTVEINPADNKALNWRQRYRYNLSLLYKNWYQFQPFLGPKQYEDLPLETRSCIWISQLFITICIVACYYAPTSMTTYEEERQLYHTLRFNIWEIIWLSFCCYLAGFLVHLLFICVIYFSAKKRNHKK